MVFIIVLLSLLTTLPLLQSGYFPMHDDLQVMRLFELQKCFAVGQIPCRWSSDMAFGFGQAMFNFYSAFPYYLGHFIRLTTSFSIVDTVKILFGISLVASGVGMYYLAREKFGKLGGLVSSVLYMFAPYRALNVYVRGAMAEAFALAILPFLWLAVYKVIKKPSFANVVILAFVFALQLITHNISSLMYAIPTFFWAIYLLSQKFSVRRIVYLGIAGVLGVGLAGFFILPAFFEKSLTQEYIFTSDYSNYIAHYVSLAQVFISRFWGYGGSIFGENDHMSFQVGWPHWWLAAIVGAYSSWKLFVNRKSDFLLPVGLVACAVIVLFLTHSRSTFIWQTIGTMAFVQFPWRFLGLAVFLLSFAGGAVSMIQSRKAKRFIIPSAIVLAVILNFQYFKPDMHFYDETDSTKLSGELFVTQQKAAFLDYIPNTVVEPPVAMAPSAPQIVEGEAEIANFNKTAGTFFFDIKVRSDVVVDVPVIYFPGWKVYLIKGQGEELDVKPSVKAGLIELSIPKGEHMVEGRFENTQIRNIGNLATGLSLGIVLVGLLIVINKKSKIDND